MRIHSGLGNWVYKNKDFRNIDIVSLYPFIKGVPFGGNTNLLPKIYQMFLDDNSTGRYA